MATRLRLGWATHKAALFACQHWHYSRALPPPPIVRIAVYEDDVFMGVILFARGANKSIATPFGLDQTQCVELVRIALRRHVTPVSRMLKQALRMLHQAAPKLELIVSYADSGQGHHGGIYQAANWIYLGPTKPDRYYRDNCGNLWHPRKVNKRGYRMMFGEVRRVPRHDQLIAFLKPPKHKYVWPFTKRMRRAMQARAMPYPRPESRESAASIVQVEEGGASPTSGLSEGASNC